MTLYLDNAATSFPKPEVVWQAVEHWQRANGRPVGRGASEAAGAVQRMVDRCRLRAAELLGAARSEQVVFTFNATDALNTALHGLLKPGDHVVTSAAEHNSVLRPLRHLEQRCGVRVTVVGVDRLGVVDPRAIEAALQPATRLIAMQHASNVTGAIQPVEEVGALARAKGIRFLVDAAQTAGHLAVDLSSLHADLLACSGHKGLLGPLGTGLLVFSPGMEREVQPLRQGGTGSRSELDTQPETMPDRFEAGNHNMPGLAGLDAALGFLLERGIAAVRDHEVRLCTQLVEQLRDIPGLTVHSGPDRNRHTGVVSISAEQFASDELAALLEGHFGIETRAGLHCAPGLHRALGTLDRQGTVRFSVGLATTTTDIDHVAESLRTLLGS